MEKNLWLGVATGANLATSCSEMKMNMNEKKEVFREPIGKFQVGIQYADTDYFGCAPYERKCSLAIFYPGAEGKSRCPYKDVHYQKSIMHLTGVDQSAEKNETANRNGMAVSEAEILTWIYEDAVPMAVGDAEVPNTEKVSNVVEIPNTDKMSNTEWKKYPVIIYNHGLMGYQMDSSVLCADLASCGFVVISIGHPFGSGAVTYADGSLFEIPTDFRVNREDLNGLGDLWKEDIAHTIDLIKSKETLRETFQIDPEAIYLMGMSFGGCISVAAALKDSRIQKAINIDGSLFTDIEIVRTDADIFVLCSPFNANAFLKLTEAGYEKLFVEKVKKVRHWEFADGIYLGEKGRSNREWADRISRNRAEMCLRFLRGDGDL